MKRLLFAVAIVAITVGVPVALAGSTPKLTGGGGSPGASYNGNNPFFVNVTAQGTMPDVKGNFSFSRADGGFGGSVDCYIQNGNEAWASGTITTATGIFAGNPFGDGFVVGVQDNGQGSTADPDMIQVDIQPHTGNLCETYSTGVSGWFPYEVTTGNFQVH